MTAPVLNETATIRDLLFGGLPVEPADEIAKSLREHGTIGSLVAGFPGLTAAVEHQVATATDGLLSLNLADVAAAGWKKYDALRQAARRTRDAPTTEEIVALATHRIESSHRPTVELSIDGRTIATIKIALQVAFNMSGVLAVVRQGRLTAIRSGTCTVAGSLAVQQIPITKRQRQFDLPGAIRLRRGVALLDATPSEPKVLSDVQSPSAAAAWYPDPTRRYEFRWWDGSEWAQRVATQGLEMSDPVACEAISRP